MDLIAQLRERRKELIDEWERLLDAPSYGAQEQSQVSRIRTTVGELNARLDELEDMKEQREAAAKVTQRMAAGSAARVGYEARTYNPATAQEGVSFLRDVARRMDDPVAARRLACHMQEAVAEREIRDVGTGAFSGLVVPQYLTDMAAPLARAGRPLADVCNQHPLPPVGMVANISRITTGASAASQSAEGAAVSETDMDDTLLSIDVRTIAGMQDVSRQAVDRGLGIDELVITDLIKAHNTELDRQLISGSGAAGQHLGIRNVSGIVSVTYTDASPTAAELYPKLADVVQLIQAGVFMGVSHWVMHPRRWMWIAKELGTTFPLLQFPATSPQNVGVAGGTAYEVDPVSRLIFGTPAVLDGNIPTNLGGGTNEDTILGVTASELHLWEEPGAPLLIRTEAALANSLQVRFVVFSYSGFTAGRYPGAQGVIVGTGLTSPVF